MITGLTEGVVVVGVGAAGEGGVARAVAVEAYMGTDEMGFPMAGAGDGAGERDLLVMGGTAIEGL